MAFLVTILIPDPRHILTDVLTSCNEKLCIGHTKSLAGDRESPLQVHRWQAGWQTIGMGSGHPLALQVHPDEHFQQAGFRALMREGAE